MMTNEAFDKPVAVSVGLGFKREIATLDEMHEFLSECSAGSRGPLREAALQACSAARKSGASVALARKALIAFASARGILWDDDEFEPMVASTALRQAVNGYAA
ncbi:MAG TPA: DUF982 domain-containing protein [Tianweitania sediminis]|jgi:hypothetical protein|nr:DUF982 domain-containing protein [Tianweitania sediminis]